jgi:ribosome-associated translation inhibitor RaiA
MSTLSNRTNLEQILRQLVEINDKTMAIQSKGKKVTQKEREVITKALKQIIEAIKDFFELQVRTSIVGNEQASYVTAVKVDGDVESIFPKELNTDVFTRHNQLVNSAWEIRKAIVEKIVDIIIAVIKAIGRLP